MTDPDRRSVAVLGGGMAGLAAAWRLSDPANADRVGQVTVYQRGGHLGGKGASTRGVNGRIEEHGLHVWLGYYDNAFRLMRECYTALDRTRTDPACPIRTWDDAFFPAPHVGLTAEGGDPWVAMFSTNDELPGEPGATAAPMAPLELLGRGLRLLGDFGRSIESPPRSGRVVLSARATAPETNGTGWAPAVRQAAHLAVAAALELASLGATQLDALTLTAGMEPLVGPGAPLGAARDQLRRLVGADPSRQRWFELVDLVVSSTRGIVADGLLVDPRGLRAIDGEEFRDWLERHGAAAETLRSPLVLGVYDLAFASVDGDPDRRRFAAGTGLYMSALMYFGYRGSMFWKMAAGMGDVVFAPLYQALQARGVHFEFFTRVDDVVPGDSGSIDTIRVTRQAHAGPFDPLVRVGGLPCFPAADPRSGTIWDPAPDEPGELRRGEHYDDVVVAMSLGILDRTCSRLVATDDRWAEMVRRVSTVATQSFQLWLREDDAELGVDRAGVTVTGGAKPFDTMSSMPHLVAFEEWPAEDIPRSVLYFCSTLATDATRRPTGPDGGDHFEDADDLARAEDRVRASAVAQLDRVERPLVPGATTTAGFRWELLCGEQDLAGPDRFRTQFWAANIDPSDRYVQSVPGSGRARIRPDESGWSNLVLAGDWTDCGLNVGCIEAATVSGLQAANALLDRPRWAQISGYWEPLERTEARPHDEARR